MMINVGQGLLNAMIFMLPMAVIAALVSMYFWERTARTQIKLIVVKTAGGTDIKYVRKEGNDVTIHNPTDNSTRTWPISELATIPMPYPDLAGLLPRFLQREIQTAILIEGDWEPLLNRSPHRTKIMSPDVIEALENIAADTPDVSEKIKSLLEGVSTGPTRSMIGAPDVLGALKVSAVMKALASVSDDLLEALKGIRNQLARFAGLNSTIIYIGLGLIIILQGFIIYQVMNAGSFDVVDMQQKINEIHNALGIK